jgi:holo-[acyl-carrier protein] synthase
MRIAQGVDLVHLPRFEEVLERHPAFTGDVFTEGERAYCEGRRRSSLHFAGRFAAKEATLKALGIGIRTGIDRALQEVEVASLASGKPTLKLSGWTRTLSERQGIVQSSVSISHSADYVVATVILLGEDAPDRLGRSR